MFRLRCWFDKKLELCLTVVAVLLNIRFGHTQISVPKMVFQCWKQPLSTPASFLVRDLVYSNESLGEMIFHIFKLKK